MSLVVVQPPGVAQALQEGVELLDALLDLEKYGLPRLGKFGSSWNCAVEMNTVHLGAQFTIRSEFDHRSPVTAALQCLERAIAAAGDRGTP